MNNNLNNIDGFKKIPKLLKTELAFKGKILNMYQDYVDIDGHKTVWDRIQHNGAAAIIPVLDNGNILLVKQFRLVAGRFTIEIPAGKLDDDEIDENDTERFFRCAKRELEEETGYTSDNIEFLLNFNTAMAYCTEKLQIFVAKNLKKGHINFDEDEELKLEEWSLEKFKEEVFAGRITDAKTIAGVFAYESKFGGEKCHI